MTMVDDCLLTEALSKISEHGISLLEMEVQAKDSEEQLRVAIATIIRQVQESHPGNHDAIEDLATFLYWHPFGIKVKFIADPLGIPVSYLCTPPHGRRNLVRPASGEYECSVCKKPQPYTVDTRAKLSKLIEDNKYDRVRTCKPCIDERDRAFNQKRAHLSDVKYWETALSQRLQATQAQGTFDPLLATMPYKDYLKTDHWYHLRRQILKAAEYRCQLCYRKDLPIHVHHRTYVRRGRERLSDLIALCERCHAKFHDRLNLPE